MATGYVFNMPYHGHVNPCLAVIQELTKRGERVVLYGTEPFRGSAEAAGAVFRPFEHEEAEKCHSLTTMAEWQMRISEQTLDSLIRDARADDLAYVIVDYTCLWGRFLAQHLRLPAIVMHSTFPTTRSRLYLLRFVLKELIQKPSTRGKLLSFMSADWRISRRWKVPRIGTPIDLLLARYGALHLVLTSREMSFAAHKLDSRYVFVGPCIRRAGISPGEPLPELDDRPLIYLSLGTFWTHPGSIYYACIEAFRDASVQVLITGRERMPADVMRNLPANFHVRSHVDQIAVLNRAAAFITHGGMNSVCEALAAEVPLLVWPQGYDQFAQAHYVETAGVGFALSHTDITPENIRGKVERLLHDQTIRSRCREAGRQLRAMGGAPMAADLILSAVRGECDELTVAHIDR